jgi:hypothetical protein
LNRIAARKTFSFNAAPTGSALSLYNLIPFSAGSFITAPSYGIVANACGTSCTTGSKSIASGLSIKASHTDGTSSVAVNAGSNLGAGFTYAADYDFYDASLSTFTGWPLSNSATEPCVKFSYNFYSNSRISYM